MKGKLAASIACPQKQELVVTAIDPLVSLQVIKMLMRRLLVPRLTLAISCLASLPVSPRLVDWLTELVCLLFDGIKGDVACCKS